MGALSRGDSRTIQNACAAGVQQAATAVAKAMDMALAGELLRRQERLETQLAEAREQAARLHQFVHLGQEAAEPHLAALEALAADGGAWCTGGQDHILGQAVATIRSLRQRLLAQKQLSMCQPNAP